MKACFCLGSWRAFTGTQEKKGGKKWNEATRRSWCREGLHGSPVEWAFICQPGCGGQCEIWNSLIVMEEPDWWVIEVYLQSVCGHQVAIFS